MEETDFFENLKFEEGGEMKTLNWEDFKDKIVILRVEPPSQGGSPPPNGGGGEPMPDDNIENPFEDELDQFIQGGGEPTGEGQEGGDGGEGQQGGEGGEGGEEDDGGEGGEGQEGGEGGEDDGGEGGEGQEGGKDDGDGIKGQQQRDRVNLDKIQSFLKSQNLKQDFRTRRNVENAIGNAQLFAQDNKEKIKKALDIIFKK